MEISLSLKPLSVPKTAPKSRFPIKNLKINRIFCSRVQELSMQRESNSTTLYKVLSLESEDVGFVEIKKAYRRLALQYHPDLCPSSKKEESTKKFVELQKAYEMLSDPDSRARYDTLLSLGGDSNIDSAVGMRGQRNQTRSKFSKMVWEDQLFELQKRSANRMEKKKLSYMEDIM